MDRRLDRLMETNKEGDIKRNKTVHKSMICLPFLPPINVILSFGWCLDLGSEADIVSCFLSSNLAKTFSDSSGFFKSENSTVDYNTIYKTLCGKYFLVIRQKWSPRIYRNQSLQHTKFIIIVSQSNVSLIVSLLVDEMRNFYLWCVHHLFKTWQVY